MDKDEVPEETLFAGEEALRGGRPPKVSPEEGIALMRERLDQLEESLKTSESDAGQFTPDQWHHRLSEITRQIYDTKRRLAEYEAQLKGRN